MKVISDIRLYKSDIENIDGNCLPNAIDKRSAHLMAHRVAMKLRESGFSLGEFDHLYLNFTVCLPPETIMPSKRTVEREHLWYRYYDIGISQNTYNELEEAADATISEWLERVLVTFFAPDENAAETIKTAVNEAVSKGSEMFVRFKTKDAAKTRAVIYLRYLDDAKYLPILCVYDLHGNECLHESLTETADLSSLGEICLSGKKVTVKPRKNAFSKGLNPVSFVF